MARGESDDLRDVRTEQRIGGEQQRVRVAASKMRERLVEIENLDSGKGPQAFASLFYTLMLLSGVSSDL